MIAWGVTMYGFESFENDYSFSSMVGSKEKEKEKEALWALGRAEGQQCIKSIESEIVFNWWSHKFSSDAITEIILQRKKHIKGCGRGFWGLWIHVHLIHKKLFTLPHLFSHHFRVSTSFILPFYTWTFHLFFFFIFLYLSDPKCISWSFFCSVWYIMS